MAASQVLALATALAACQASAHNIRRVVHLQPNATSAVSADDLLREKAVSAFEGAFSAPKHAAKDATKQPVAVQVEDKAIEQTQEKLSPKCRKRFDAMMDGKGPQMASFTAHDSPDGGKQCDKLMGKLCRTEAQISEQSAHTDGRKLEQVVSVEGNSCVPAECAGRSDLGAIAQFMHAQTKEIMPGEDLHVNLHVNCAALGGGDVTVDHRGTLACTAPTGGSPTPCSGAKALPLAAAGLAAILGAVLAA